MPSPALDVQNENAHGSAAFQSDGGRSVEIFLKDFSGLFAHLSGGYPCLVFHAVGVPDHLVGHVIAVAVDSVLGAAIAFGRAQTFQERGRDKPAPS